ncbi:rho GTPase-activating protein 15 isoform X2 [Drosophila teissieri]|uniref:rho GTPase-activating protein 15 isoform X2 n=1 Tax=Drosophila teissieri TaxID=7243 RepID=UPI001CBA3E0A|nr:rho GTPase-activating protein 15 isoform X2 [Drosophila teissieri]XP_043661363.1 rho GTPase-activating protein 15 isoform X2 [Drosophila teissieri]XP_043661364.1 rho GTPase-activating protein 15 isoform X2 [Drosophila teissieri]
MAGDAENKRGYRTIFRSISQVFYANAKNSSNAHSNSNNNNNIISSYNNNTIENNNEGIGRLTVTLTSITPPTATWTSTSPTISTCTTATSASAGSSTASSSPLASRSAARSAENISCSECGNPDPYHGQDMESTKGQAPTPEVPASVDLRTAVPAAPAASCAEQNQKLRASSMLDLTSNHRQQNALRIVPVTDILRAQQIQEDNEVQQTQQTTILQRFKSVSIGNLLDLPGEDDKKSIKNRMRMKFAVNSNVFRINRSPKSEKKSRPRRGQVNSLYLDEHKYPLFAAPLSALELNMTDHPNVPRFVVDVCTYIEQPQCIEQDGLYRASGNKVLVDELRKKLTHIYDPRLLHTDDIHTLTSLHKQFFRELTAPLITQEAYERLGRSLNDDAAIERMSLAFDDMPEPNRSTLRFLIRHLTRVAAASASNRMPSTNLAIVWGPCLLSANQIQLDIGRMNMLAKVLIENYDRIFHPDNERLVC